MQILWRRRCSRVVDLKLPYAKKIGRWELERFSSQKLHFEIFPKTNAISISFGPRYIHGQSLKEIDFPTRNTVDRF